MRCPYCSFLDTGVIESRVTSDLEGIRRRRECLKCKKRFTTFERVVNIDLRVEKRDGQMQDFDRDKLERGIVKACWKRDISKEKMQEIVDEVEMKLLNRKSTVVKSTDIGKLVLTKLKKVDPVAYLRFASVYFDFDNLSDFVEVMKKIQ